MPPELGVTVGGHHFDDLDYADDSLPIVDACEQVLAVLEKFEEMAGIVGLHPSWCKMKIQNLGAGPPGQCVTVGGVIVKSSNEFALSWECPLQMRDRLQMWDNAWGYLPEI